MKDSLATPETASNRLRRAVARPRRCSRERSPERLHALAKARSAASSDNQQTARTEDCGRRFRNAGTDKIQGEAISDCVAGIREEHLEVEWTGDPRVGRPEIDYLVIEETQSRRERRKTLIENGGVLFEDLQA